MAKDPNVYLAHARDCADKVILFASEGEQIFLNDAKTRDAILRNLEIIGQCLKNAGTGHLEQMSPGTPWRQITDFRNVLAHAYLAVDLNMVWAIVENHIQELRLVLNKLLENWQP